MKVLYIVNVMADKQNPSTQPFVKAQIESMKKIGVDVSILNIKGNESKLNYLISIQRMRNLLKEKRFDIIHGHYVYSGWIAAFQRKAPVVVSFMGSDLHGSFKANGTLYLKGYFDIWVSKILQFFVKGIVVKSIEMQKKLLTKKKSVVLPNGVDFDLFREMSRDDACKKLGLDLKKKYILFAGHYKNPQKGFSILKKAIDILKVENHNVELLLAQGLEQNAIPFYMNASNVLALPSLREGSPNVIKEAMACNLPIVATDVGDVRELIEGVRGCKIVKRDPLEFVKAIKQIIATLDRTNGRSIIDHLRIENTAQRLKRFYEKLLYGA
jgi:teichuronic acid biosynthesis glycosyltransferase TuaC